MRTLDERIRWTERDNSDGLEHFAEVDDSWVVVVTLLLTGDIRFRFYEKDDFPLNDCEFIEEYIVPETSGFHWTAWRLTRQIRASVQGLSILSKLEAILSRI